MAQVRGRHWRQNALSSRNPSAVLSNCWRASTVPLALITTTVFIRLCGSTPITTFATDSSLLACVIRSEEGSATSSLAFPSRATPRKAVSDGSAPLSSHTARSGQPVREPPVEHLAPGWPAQSLRWWF